MTEDKVKTVCTEVKFSFLRCFIVLTLLIFWSLLLPFLYLVSLLLPFYESQQLCRVFHQGVCALMGLKVEFIGEYSREVPTLFVSNHVSYLDIFSLGQKVPGFFVAKSEVGGWPVLNKLAKLQNTVFIDRKSGKAKQQIAQLGQYLKEGDNLILFPEGTSTNGAEVKPFKSSLFAATQSDETDIYIQPISIVYTQYEGRGMTQNSRDTFAWYADMPFGSHFLKVAGARKVEVIVSFSKPVLLSEFSSRKECAKFCEEAVRSTFNQSFSDSDSII